MNTKTKIQIARDFRKNPTKSEEMMWDALRKRSFMNLKFRRQYLIDGYAVDFYCPELNLAIEIDGSIHNNHLEEDKHRQNSIERSGIYFFRAKSEKVENNISEILKELSMFINNLISESSFNRYSRHKNKY